MVPGKTLLESCLIEN